MGGVCIPIRVATRRLGGQSTPSGAVRCAKAHLGGCETLHDVCGHRSEPSGGGFCPSCESVSSMQGAVTAAAVPWTHRGHSECVCAPQDNSGRGGRAYYEDRSARSGGSRSSSKDSTRHGGEAATAGAQQPHRSGILHITRPPDLVPPCIEVDRTAWVQLQGACGWRQQPAHQRQLAVSPPSGGCHLRARMQRAQRMVNHLARRADFLTSVVQHRSP